MWPGFMSESGVGTINKACNFSDVACEQWHKQLQDNENPPTQAGRQSDCLSNPKRTAHHFCKSMWTIKCQQQQQQQQEWALSSARNARSFCLYSSCLLVYWVQTATAFKYFVWFEYYLSLPDFYWYQYFEIGLTAILIKTCSRLQKTKIELIIERSTNKSIYVNIDIKPTFCQLSMGIKSSMLCYYTQAIIFRSRK